MYDSLAPKKIGRPRALDRKKKLRIDELVGAGATLGEAACEAGVSLRTVERELHYDPDFARRLREAQGCEPDYEKVMQRAARTHWRACAWMLERQDPEQYGRRRASSASPFQVETALGAMIEAALDATAPEARSALYEQLRAASEETFKRLFPTYGQGGRRERPAVPATPLADQQRRAQLRPLEDRVAAEGYPALDALWRAAHPDAPAGRENPLALAAAQERGSAGLSPPASSIEPPAPGDQPPASSIQNPASSPPRLSWRYKLRAAGSAASLLPKSRKAPQLRVLSEKRRVLTKPTGDNSPESGSLPPGSGLQPPASPR
jgi:hypothetical protein